MAYRRRQGITRASTYEEEIYAPNNYENDSGSSNSSSSSLAARAIRASAAHRDSSAYGSAYGGESFRPRDSNLSRSKEPVLFESTSMKVPDESKYGFWGILARKAKAILEEENVSQQFEGPNRMQPQMTNTSTEGQVSPQQQSSESVRRMDNARLRKGLDVITSSLNHIGDTIGNALEEGRTIVENKTADIIQETRKLQSKRRGGFSESSWQQPGIQPSQMHVQTNQETQLKASRDVAMATAAKAKLLLRELKTTKADLAFARERCAQLEEENKRLRESREKGDNHADDDLIRLQLETLLAEKARLAHENSIYARENRFLREIVEYHQLTMQDVVYLDEGSEEVTEVYPISINDAKVLSSSPTSPTSPVPLPGTSSSSCPRETKEYTSRCSLSSHPLEKKELNEASTALKESASV